jgi:hypothetical protein
LCFVRNSPGWKSRGVPFAKTRTPPDSQGRGLGNPHARGMGRLLEGSVSETQGCARGCPGVANLTLTSAAAREFPARTRPFQTRKKELNLKESKFIGRLTMSSSKLPAWLIATTMLLSMGFVLYPQGSANAAKYCAQLRGATAEGHPDCSFSTLDKCRARVRHRGGGHCYRSH